MKHQEENIAKDCDPGGMVLVGRTFGSEEYRFGFNGQEQDREIYGANNAYSFEYRVHDPRLGRFLSVDPLAPQYAWNSTYAFAENRPIDGIDLEGLEWTFALPRIFWRTGPKLGPIEIFIPKPPTMPYPPVLPIPPTDVWQPPTMPSIKTDINWYDPPLTPNDLGEDWTETTHPDNTSGRNRDFENNKTGEKIRYDLGDEKAEGNGQYNHWHRLNPKYKKSMKGKGKYLDRDGNPIDYDSPDGHIVPGENVLPSVIIFHDKKAWDKYDKQMKKHEKGMEKYEKKMQKYENDVQKYKKKLQEYYKKCDCYS